MEVDHRCYQYNIALPPFSEDHPIHKNLIPYWRFFWKNLLLKIKSNESLYEDELYWQDRIAYITHEKNIVAIQFIANYKSHEFEQSEYAQRYLPKGIGKILQRENGGGGYSINTLQYLSVNPIYNHRNTRIHFSSILSDLNTLHHQELKASTTLSIVRNSVGVHNMASKFGCKIYSSTNRHGENSTIMYCSNPKRHTKNSIIKISDHFWNNRNFISKTEFAA